MKEYKKLIKKLKKNSNFKITSFSRKNTVKLIHIESGRLYSIHPSDKAVKPLLNWIKKINGNIRI